MIPIAFTDCGRGTASIEPGKRGGRVVVLRRGYPVAAEVVGAFPAASEVAHRLGLLEVADSAAVARAGDVAR